MAAGDPLDALAVVKARSTADGGFAALPGRRYRPDATAWAVLALAAAGEEGEVMTRARRRLAVDQRGDGSVPLDRGDEDAFWPTAVAAMAWHGDPLHEGNEDRAARFLLCTEGRHWQQDPASPTAHDTSIRGWPWVAGSHSWVEPTALAVIALRLAGRGEADRVREGVRMLLDRQLPSGGWNYGNSVVFGKELEPMPLGTGLALRALAGLAAREEVGKSIAYLDRQAAEIRTPLSLGWGLLGLAAWGIRPARAREWILDSLRKQEALGAYDTSALSLLVIASASQAGAGAAAFSGAG